MPHPDQAREPAGDRQTQSRTDPRIERSRLVIRQAALDELGAAGYGAFAIESVATRAGVAKSTIYRHWPDKLALIADALETFHKQAVPHIQGVSPPEHVQLLGHHVPQVLVDSTFSACIPALIEGAEPDPRLRELHPRHSSDRRQSLIDVIAEGVAAGDFPAR